MILNNVYLWSFMLTGLQRRIPMLLTRSVMSSDKGQAAPWPVVAKGI
jgi:hypothetical protein